MSKKDYLFLAVCCIAACALLIRGEAYYFADYGVLSDYYIF